MITTNIVFYNLKVSYCRFKLRALDAISNVLAYLQTRISLWMQKSPRQQQKAIRNMFKKLLWFILAVIIIYIIVRFVWYWGFVKPNIRDQAEAAKSQNWQQQVTEYKK